MAMFDMPQSQLEQYLPNVPEPADFDAFWQESLTQTRQHALNAQFVPYQNSYHTVDVFDVTFAGWAGQPIKGWFLLPKHRTGPIPCVIEYIGYGGGRSYPNDWLLWSSRGYAHFVMDTRGQGSAWSRGDTPDPEPADTNPHHPGFMTRGIRNKHSYYYRRVFCDAVRAIEAARSHIDVDATRIAVTGGSQGGGIAIAAAGLTTDVNVAMPDVPFLCHYRRASEITDSNPYSEISRYLMTHREAVEQVFETLSYFDGINFAKRANATALFSVGMMDDICPPSTVYAAYNHWQGHKEMSVWRYNRHEGGGTYQSQDKMHFMQRHLPLN
jgi:cephalosporin-C deacetylase